MRPDTPKKYYELAGKCNKSRKSAVRLMCLECMGYDSREVTGCTDKNCPLYHWRVKG
jgi:hypothetical protein